MEYKSLLETTQNTRDLGGYETCYGRKTKSFSVLRSDRQGYASDRDKKFLVNHDITTVIDMRTEEDVKKNIEFDSVQKAIEAAVNAPIPDVD